MGWALVVTQRTLLAAAVVKSIGQVDGSLSGCSVYPMDTRPRSWGLCSEPAASLSVAPVTHGQEPHAAYLK